ncbi:MAG TPA: hypothetical protein VIA18_28900 [Polyangia bacterium]|nr:hypothetical protein [Polyangia bacterium]
MAATTSDVTSRRNGFELAAMGAPLTQSDSEEVARLRAAVQTLAEMVVAHGVMDARTLHVLLGDLVEAPAKPVTPSLPAAPPAVAAKPVAPTRPLVSPAAIGARPLVSPAQIASRPTSSRPTAPTVQTPVAQPQAAPIARPPVAAPAPQAPVAQPIQTHAPVAQPIQTQAPVAPQVKAPVAPQAQAPIAPVAPPVHAPVAKQAQAPVAPITPPVHAPAVSSVAAPVAKPVAAPVVSSAQAAVAKPVAQPVRATAAPSAPTMMAPAPVVHAAPAQSAHDTDADLPVVHAPVVHVPTPPTVDAAQLPIVHAPIVHTPAPRAPQPQPQRSKNPFDAQLAPADVEAALKAPDQPPAAPGGFFGRLFNRKKASPAQVAAEATSVEFTERVPRLPDGDRDGLYGDQQRATELSFPPTEPAPKPRAAATGKRTRGARPAAEAAPSRFCDRCWRRMDASGTCKTCSPAS